MPPMKLCVAAGIDTPRLTVSAAASAGKAAMLAAAMAPSARRRVREVMLLVSCCEKEVERTGKRIRPLALAALQEGHDDDHDALHRGIQVHADDAGEVQDVADDRQQDRADHGARDAAGT